MASYSMRAFASWLDAFERYGLRLEYTPVQWGSVYVIRDADRRIEILEIPDRDMRRGPSSSLLRSIVRVLVEYARLVEAFEGRDPIVWS